MVTKVYCPLCLHPTIRHQPFCADCACRAGCTCHPIVLNGRDWAAHVASVGPMARDQIVGYDWQADCPAHGLESDWYKTSGKTHLDAQNQESVRLQRLARKARESSRAVCRTCEEFQDECACPQTYSAIE